MPKTGRPRSRVGLSAVAMVPRQHSAPIACAEVVAVPPRSASGRARAAAVGDRASIAVLAFLLGFAACYVMLRHPDRADTVPYARTTSSGIDAASRLP
jgi:hypothetical protein